MAAHGVQDPVPPGHPSRQRHSPAASSIVRSSPSSSCARTATACASSAGTCRPSPTSTTISPASTSVARFDVLGHRFDGLAVDIEDVDTVTDVDARNQRLVDLSQRLRTEVGSETLGAIVLPPVLTEVVNPQRWPDFPWPQLAPLYDVWLPMSYWTFRTSVVGLPRRLHVQRREHPPAAHRSRRPERARARHRRHRRHRDARRADAVRAVACSTTTPSAARSTTGTRCRPTSADLMQQQFATRPGRLACRRPP